ncbi:fibrinogen C domain-containing protein 1-like [Dysidea avara]|uniref:fibrinogen C domain-containing protein 1-like n=1 Tax=Dysidea avara TaxID=196820 RepID=UPI0033258214
MKSQLVILLILVSSLLATTDADQQCDNLLQQCSQFKTKCSPSTTTIRSCCDLTDFPASKAPSGVYQIVLSNGSCELSQFITESTVNANVYCDMDTTDGGWMVIQRNINDGVKTFDKKWRDYEEGFGDLNGNKLWYGLKALNRITEMSQWELRIEFTFEDNKQDHFYYKRFKVGNAIEGYPLTVEIRSGLDPISQSMGMKFSTKDNDNDKDSSNCAASLGSGWWYRGCALGINPNHQPPQTRYSSRDRNLRSIEMKIRPHNCVMN